VKDLLDDKGLALKLKAGKHLPIKGVYSGAGRKLYVEFSYNRTFPSVEKYPEPGSWSREMRPDYTLSLWPDGFTQVEAERQELITHVHFDAKYKVDQLSELFGTRADDLDKVKTNERAGTYKRADLLKMHAYRDAIRRSAGAYVIYPGDQPGRFKGFHEILPGLGAFPLRPGSPDGGSSALAEFLRSVALHASNRATQWERETYQRYNIHKTEPVTHAVRELPEQFYTHDERHPPAAETSVVLGFIRRKAIQICREKGIFYFHAVDESGNPAQFDPSVLKATYLVPYTENDEWLGWFAPIVHCELVRKIKMFAHVPADVLEHQRPYYYLVHLNKLGIKKFASLPTATTPRPGAPVRKQWVDLFLA
jgi:hypothetical protein